MWINPTFHLKVIRTFDEVAQGQIKRPKHLLSEEVQARKLAATAKAFKAYQSVLKTVLTDKNQIAIASSQAAYKATGVDLVKESGVALIAPVQNIQMTPTDIGKELKPNISAIGVNKMLETLGLQTKVGKGWKATKSGERHCVYLDTGKKHSDGTPVTQMKWFESVTPLVKVFLKENPQHV